MARGRRVGARAGCGRQEGLRDYGRGKEVSRGAPGPDRGHFRPGEGRGERRDGRIDGGDQSRRRTARERGLSHRLEDARRGGAEEGRGDSQPGHRRARRAGESMNAPELTQGLRASDAERERIAQLLQSAAAEGRLSPDEAGERLAAASAATYRQELERLVADLPVAVEVAAVGTRGRPGPGFWMFWGLARVALVML